MSRALNMAPAEADLLCETCGYTLNGLPRDSNCPECGTPIAASLGSGRTPPAWESDANAGNVRPFLMTSIALIFRPTRFYRTVTTRGDVRRSAVFGRLHWLIASLMFGTAATIHAGLFNPVGSLPAIIERLFTGPIGAIVYAIVAFIGLWSVNWAAVRLTVWEAAYRGYRLPTPVVARGINYHAAHYFPVAVIALLTVGGYAILLHNHTLGLQTLPRYLYVLCTEVIVAAGYLFHTYWIGMRNMMFANR